MNKIIQGQLNKTNLVMQQVDKNTFYIPLQKPPEPLKFEKEHYYIIKLADYILHPYEGYTLQDNWNHGVIPKSEYMKCFVKQKMGQMVQIDGSGYNIDIDKDLYDDIYYDLWLPTKGVKIIKEI